MITHDTLLRVRETARIDEVAAGYLTLRRSGKDLVALCPFHDERHPSFRISPALNIGKCFSCGEAADPIRLVRHMEGCGFEEAVRLLARKYGIEVEERGTEEAGRHEARQAILCGNEAFARSLLPYDPAEGITGEDENGEEDLRALRETFSGVGICPPDAPEGFRRFRRRLVFPVRTTGGQIAGFAGRYRGTEGAGTAKYINSDNSEAYNKGRILYGLYEAVRAVRAEGDVLLCEGYKDVIAFHAAGIRHAAGLCGTALTEDHVRVIRRLTGHVTLALDPDPAGQAATLRSARLLLAQGCEVGLLPLPGGMDPDEMFRRKGAEALRRLVRTEAVDYLSHRIRKAAGRKGGPDELLPDEAERQLFLYAEPFIHDRLQRTAARLRSATSTDERATCLKELRDCFALSDRIGRALGSQSVRRVEG